eukprot:gene19657-21604_t
MSMVIKNSSVQEAQQHRCKRKLDTLRYCGLFDCDIVEEFDEKVDALKTIWNERENLESGNSFYEWFKNEKAEIIRDSMLKKVRTEACYGCGNAIHNPPVAQPDDIVIVYRDIRSYRDQITGLHTWSDREQNVHFHLKLACLLRRYPHFETTMLKVPNAFILMLTQQHFMRLKSEFGS